VKRVLIVDDNADLAQAVQALLEMDGHSVALARDGGSAMAAARATRPEVVLLDIGLEDADGYEVARRMRTDGLLDGVRLIAISGYGQPDDLLRAREAGFDQHMTKPIDPIALLRAVDAKLR